MIACACIAYPAALAFSIPNGMAYLPPPTQQTTREPLLPCREQADPLWCREASVWVVDGASRTAPTYLLMRTVDGPKLAPAPRRATVGQTADCAHYVQLGGEVYCPAPPAGPELVKVRPADARASAR